MKNRINFLDGFRGLAILLVILYHAYSRWPSVVPYKNKFASMLLFQQGILGVQLFFLISGFVILMSLEKNDTFSTFLYKRWLRLFPAMLIASSIIFLTATYLPERPIGIPSSKDVLPGLLFIQPIWMEQITGINFGLLEGSFWSLFVEVKFYLVFGLLYFSLGTKKATIALATLYLIWFFLTASKLNFYPTTKILDVLNLFDIHHFGWFACGAFSYLFYTTKTRSYLLYAILIGGISTLIYHKDLTSMIFMIVLLTIFIGAIYFEKVKAVFANHFFLFFGFISYPLYLIHENAMIALIIKSGKHLSFIPHALLPIIPIVLLSIIAYFIAKIIEPLLQKSLKKNLQLLFTKMRIQNQLPG